MPATMTTAAVATETQPALPRVSVIIPTYNHARYVLGTLESVFAQTFRDFEVIVVNDGSPDNTAEVLRPLAQSGRIHYVEQVNAGQAAARNRGIAQARGEFIALLDDDDLWPPDKLQWQVQAMRQHPEVDVVYGRPECINEHGQPLTRSEKSDNDLPVWLLLPQDGEERRGSFGHAPWTRSGDIYESLMEQNFIVSPGQCLIRAQALGTLGGRAPFDPAIRGCDDWDLWLRLARNGRFLYQDRVMLRYRLHAANASRDVTAMCRSSLALRRKQWRSDPDPIRRKRWGALYRQAQSELAVMLFVQAKARARSRRWVAACLLLVAALFRDCLFGVGKLLAMAGRYAGRPFGVTYCAAPQHGHPDSDV